MTAAASAAVLTLHERDNILKNIAAGTELADGVTAAERGPSGHKIARRAIACGDVVVKYGQIIGVATVDIPAGAHVHVQRTLAWASTSRTTPLERA
jgi:altronate dehydratase